MVYPTTYLPPIHFKPWPLEQSGCDPEYLNEYIALKGTPESELLQAMFKSNNGITDFTWSYKPLTNTSHYKVHYKGYNNRFSYSAMAELYEPARGKRFPKYDKRKSTNVLRPPVMVSKLARVTGMVKAFAAVKELRKELLSGNLKKVIIFTNNRDVVWCMREHLRDLKAISLIGNMTR